MTGDAKPKRLGGEITAIVGNETKAAIASNQIVWRVISESTKGLDGWVHSCGTEVLEATVVLSNRDGVGPLTGDGRTRVVTVPFCPNCERKPTSGTFGPGDEFAITS